MAAAAATPAQLLLLAAAALWYGHVDAAAAGEKGMLLVAQPQAHAQADDDAVVTVTICPLPSALVFAGSPLNSSTPRQLELAARPGTCLVASMDGDET